MASCAGIKADGGRCGAQAMRGSEWCIGHDPDKAEARRRRASKGGKRGGRGRPVVEVADLKARLEDLYGCVLAGTTEPKVGAVANQIVNTRARLIETELRIREQQELIERLEELETLVQQQKEQEGGRWGA
jgi:hypothetical protein